MAIENANRAHTEISGEAFGAGNEALDEDVGSESSSSSTNDDTS